MREIRTTNKGLTVKINFWSLDKYKDGFDSTRARHHIKGQALNANTGKFRFFRDAGQLLTILSDWQSLQVKKLKRADRSAGVAS